MTDTRARCKATTKSGSRCRLKAQPDADYCHVHADFGDAQVVAIQADEPTVQTVASGEEADLAVDAASMTEPVRDLPLASDDAQESDETQSKAEAPVEVFDADVRDHRHKADEIAQDVSATDESAKVVDTKVAENRSVTAQSDAEAEATTTETSAVAEMLVAAHDRQAAVIDDELDDVEAEVDAVDADETVNRGGWPQPDLPPTQEHEAEEVQATDSTGVQPALESNELLDANAVYERVAESRESSPREEQVATLVAEIEELAQELCRRLDQSSLRPSTPAQAMALFNQHVGKYAPETQRALFADIQRNLQDARYRDLADPDVLRGLWYMLYFALQNQSQEVRERVARQLSAIPGYENMTELARRLQAGSADRGATTQPAGGIKTTFNHLLQNALRALRKLLSVGSER